MPDLPNRDQFEQQLTEELSRVISSARNTLVDALWEEGMTQGDIANAPDETLQALENELVRVLETSLAEAYVAAAENFAQEMQYGLATDVLQEDAAAWATDYADDLASQLINTRQNKLSEIAERAPDVQLQKKDLISLIVLALGLGGVAAIAITELSNATSAGEEYTQRELERAQVSVEVLWYTQEDERVCPVCRPRHATAQGDGWQLPPPAHPRCRCYKGYRITSANGETQVIFNEEEVAQLT